MFKQFRWKRWSLVLGAFTAFWTVGFLGIVDFSWAGVPQTSSTSLRGVDPREELKKEQAVSDQMRELGLAPEMAPDFEADLAQLASRERRHREKLPSLAEHPRLKGVIARVSSRRYSEK